MVRAIQLASEIRHHLVRALKMLNDLGEDNGVLSPDDINWFHSIDLDNGIVTRGHKSAALLEEEFARLGLTAATLRDKRVLDIGCNDGFMSLRCEQLGAHVTGIDGVYRDGLKYVRRHLRPKFRFYMIDLMSPSFSELGRFDVILYLGILYHTMYPFEQLLRVAAACNAAATLFLSPSTTTCPASSKSRRSCSTIRGQIVADLCSPVFPSIAWIVQTLTRVGFEDVTVLHRVGHDQRGRVTLRASTVAAQASPRFCTPVSRYDRREGRFRNSGYRTHYFPWGCASTTKNLKPLNVRSFQSLSGNECGERKCGVPE